MTDAIAVGAALREEITGLGLEPDEAKELLRGADALLAGSAKLDQCRRDQRLPHKPGRALRSRPRGR
jgi:hypothetical protein